MIEEVQQRIAQGYCYLCATDHFQHKELCANNPNRPRSVQPEVGGIYRFRTLPRSIFAPSEGVARIWAKEWTKSHGMTFMIQLQKEDGTWMFDDKPYGRVSLYDVEFYSMESEATNG